MTTGGGFRGYRWRRLTPEQNAAISDALNHGVRARDLAREYDVHVRTIYRAASYARHEIVAEAKVDGWRATYAITDEGPVQLTPWVPAEGSVP